MKKYYYVACEASDEQKVNPKFQHYFRLYKTEGGAPILVEQGLTDKIEEWEQRFGAVFENINPYPELD